MASKDERIPPRAQAESRMPGLDGRSVAVCFGQWFFSEEVTQTKRSFRRLEQSLGQVGSNATTYRPTSNG